jgi:hypothetical protein
MSITHTIACRDPKCPGCYVAPTITPDDDDKVRPGSPAALARQLRFKERLAKLVAPPEKER